jgi:hypothetical protein
MKGFVLSVVLLMVATGAFVGGMFSAQTGLVLAGFCASPILLFVVGWTAHSAMSGKRIVLVAADEQPQQRRSYTPEREASRLKRQRQEVAVNTRDGVM